MGQSFSTKLPIVDGHLDLAENVTLFGRDLTLSAAEIKLLEIDTVADLYKVGAAVPAETQAAVLSHNWLNFLRRCLPQTS